MILELHIIHFLFRLEKAKYTGLVIRTVARQYVRSGENAKFQWKFQKNGSSLEEMNPVRAYLAIWNREDQSFLELFVARAENKTRIQPFLSDEKLKYGERIAWTGNFTEMLFSFTMTNISFEDNREFFLLVFFKAAKSYKAILVFTSSYLEVQGN